MRYFGETWTVQSLRCKEGRQSVCMVSVGVDNKGGNVPFAIKWAPRGQRPPTA